MKVSAISSSNTKKREKQSNTTEREKSSESEERDFDTLLKSSCDEIEDTSSAIDDLRLYAETSQVTSDRYKEYFLMESKCRRIYHDLMEGKQLISQDKNYLLKNKAELYTISDAMGEEDSRRAEKILKNYENMQNIEEYHNNSDPKVELLV